MSGHGKRAGQSRDRDPAGPSRNPPLVRIVNPTVIPEPRT